RNTINGGFANGCNLGAGKAAGQFLLFLNPDTVVEEAAAEKLINAARSDHQHYILSCRQVREDGRENRVTGKFPELWNFTGFLRSISGTGKIERSAKDNIFYPDWVSGSVMLIRREIFFKLTGFDEDFWMYSEDVDLCRQARDMGGKVVLCGEIVVEHNHGGSSRTNLITASLTKCEVLISRHVYIHKHKKGAERLIFQSLMVINNLITGLVTAFIGIILFFVPGVLVRSLVFLRLLRYYSSALYRHSWLSPRSVSLNKSHGMKSVSHLQ
ncbi:MAG: glycosyltransferase family 2 protein, partial [Bacteroidales bacterium]|nr:glycosyltransferase family 2 protein [Bacteroidales bacterium]